jgi:hypothetical protein
MDITRRDTLLAITGGLIVGLPTIALARPDEPELFRGVHNEPAVDYGAVPDDWDDFERFPYIRRKSLERLRRAFRRVAAGLYEPAYRSMATKRDRGFAAYTFEYGHDGLPHGYAGTDYEYEVACWAMEKVADHFRSMRLPVQLVSLKLTQAVINPATFEPMIPYAMEWNE